MGWAGGEEGDGGNRAFVRGDGERTGVVPRRGGAWGNSLLGRKRMYSRWGRKVLEGRLVVVTTIGVSQEPSLEVGDQIDRLDMFGGHLGVDLVGDPDELRGVAVDIFMVDDVSGPETCEEVGSVDIRVRRELLD